MDRRTRDIVSNKMLLVAKCNTLYFSSTSITWIQQLDASTSYD